MISDLRLWRDLSKCNSDMFYYLQQGNKDMMWETLKAMGAALTAATNDTNIEAVVRDCLATFTEAIKEVQ